MDSLLSSTSSIEETLGLQSNQMNADTLRECPWKLTASLTLGVWLIKRSSKNLGVFSWCANYSCWQILGVKNDTKGGGVTCRTQGTRAIDYFYLLLYIIICVCLLGFLNVTTTSAEVKVAIGENVTLDCVTTYPDEATMGQFWTLNGTHVDTTNGRYTTDHRPIEDTNSTQNNTENKIKIINTKVAFSLTIRNVTLADLGLYTCGVNTTLGMQQRSIHVSEASATSTGKRRKSLIHPLYWIICDSSDNSKPTPFAGTHSHVPRETCTYTLYRLLQRINRRYTASHQRDGKTDGWGYGWGYG